MKILAAILFAFWLTTSFLLVEAMREIRRQDETILGLAARLARSDVPAIRASSP
jgi:hypothetical protein